MLLVNVVANDPLSPTELTFLPSPPSHHQAAHYIHRCPFTHCCHQGADGHPTPKGAPGLKIPLDPLKPSPFFPRPALGGASKEEPFPRGGYGARGAPSAKVGSQYRHRAIMYMLSRLRVKRQLSTDDATQRRLFASILTLEHKVFQDSDSKEKYMENLATKLFIIFQELERRRVKGAPKPVPGSVPVPKTKPYTDISLTQTPVKK